jgi:hypothetical protein
LIFFLFISWRLSSTTGTAIIVRALEVPGHLGLLLLVLFPETQHVVGNTNEATLEARAFGGCHTGGMGGGDRASSAKKSLRKRGPRGGAAGNGISPLAHARGVLDQNATRHEGCSDGKG